MPLSLSLSLSLSAPIIVRMSEQDSTGPQPPREDDPLRRAYRAGYEAAQRGEEADPGCTVTDLGRAWLRGYVDGAATPRA